MKKLNYVVNVLLVSLATVEVCMPVGIASQRKSPLQALVSFCRDLIKSPEGLKVEGSTLSQDNRLLPWQGILAKQFHREYPGFTCKIVSDDVMEISGDFTVGLSTWRVLEINGQPVKSDFDVRIHEERVSWAPKIVVTQTPQSGVYDIFVETPKPGYFERLNSVMVRTGVTKTRDGIKCHESESCFTLRSGERYLYKGVTNLENFFHKTHIVGLRPDHPIYSE